MSLQRETMVRAALALLNEVGIDALSTRKLADRLGMQSPSLYWHFKSKQALLNDMAEAMLAERNAASLPREGVDWREWFAESGRSFRRALLTYRDGARVHAGTRPDMTGLPALEAKVRLLCNAGFAPADALRAIATQSRYVVGWVLEEQAETEANGERPLPAASFQAFPLLAAGADVWRQTDPDGDFDYGLWVIIKGLEAKLGESSPS